MNRLILISACLFLSCAVHAQNIISTVVGNGFFGYTGDGGPATAARIANPLKVFVDESGNIYFSDMLYNHVVRKVSASTGIVTTVVGNGTSGYSGDGGPATAAQIYWPAGMCKNSSGDLLVTDQWSHVIRRISATTGNISTIAGTGVMASNGNGGPATAAALYSPSCICVDASDNIFFTEYGSGTIRRIDAITGIITTVAGTGVNATSTDGGAATSSALNKPEGLVVDNGGNIYVADVNSRRIRKVDAGTGIITTIAGTGISGLEGDGGPATNAKIRNATDIAINDSGDIYISDLSSSVIRKINAAGIITTIAGNGSSGYSGDGGFATDAELSSTSGVSFHAGSNSLFFADGSNNVIRKISNLVSLQTPSVSLRKSITVAPNPFTDRINVNGLSGNEKITVSTIMGNIIYSTEVGQVSQTTIYLNKLQKGIYVLTVYSETGGKPYCMVITHI